MKKSGLTIVFLIVCIGVLVAAYGVGVCVREIRFYRAKTQQEVVADADKSSAEAQPKVVVQNPTPPPGNLGPENRPALGGEESEGGPPRPRMGGFGGGPGMPTREDFANMTDEERQAAFAKMRERFGGFGGRQREGGPQLSEEDRAKMREEYEKLRENWDQMTDEEKQKVEEEFREKYGYFRSPDRRGGRGFGSRRPSGGSDDGSPAPKGRTCFVADTPVLVDGQWVQISKVSAGQIVGHRFYGASLEQVQEHEGTFECRDIVFESGHTISVVDAHCFMLDSGQWIAAQNLINDLRLKTLTGTVRIKSVTKRAVPYIGKVYNLKVKNSDQYIVGKDSVIVRDY